MEFKSKFLNVMQERGFLNLCSNFEGMDVYLYDCEQKNVPAVGYFGSDPSADSLHVGHLCAAMMMRWFQKCGHKPIMLVGGATGMIGDPKESGERPMLSLEDIEKNKVGLQKSYAKFFNFGGENDKSSAALMVDNYDWFKDVGYLDFLREVGKIVPVGKLLGLDRIRKRVNSELGISFLEFNYPLLQGFDFYKLYKKHNCMLQLCGSDQWGNSIMGLEIIRKKERKEVFVFSTALLTDSSGKKMGKSEGNAVWVNDEKLSSYDYYQYFRNVADADVKKLLLIFTELDVAKIEELCAVEGQALNDVKKILAFEATKMCRGEDEAKRAEQTAVETFEKGLAGGDLPKVELDFSVENNIVDVLVLSGMVSSKKEARRMIDQGAVKIVEDKIDNYDFVVTADLKEKVISVGKKKKFTIL